MKTLLRTIAIMIVAIIGSNIDVSAAARDGQYEVTQGNTVSASISSAYRSTLARATSVNARWSTSDPNISIQSHTNTTCTVKGISPVTAARLNYYCSYYIDGYYRTMDFYYEITVKSSVVYVTTVEINYSSISLEEGNGQQLTAYIYPTNATNRSVTWSSTNSSVVSVSSSGYITAKSAGNARIKAVAKDGSGCYDYCNVTVTAKNVPVTSVSLSTNSITLTEGQTYTLGVSVYPYNATNSNVIWSTMDANVATVNSLGTITAVKEGTATIKAQAKDGSGCYDTCTVTVLPATVNVTSLELSPEAVELRLGESYQLQATILPADATNQAVSWTTSDPSVATVSPAGVVTAVGQGTATIQATSDDNSQYTDRCEVTVVRPTLTLIQPNGRITLDISYLQSINLELVADEGCTIHSVTLNGQVFDEYVDACEANITIENEIPLHSQLQVVFEVADSGIEQTIVEALSQVQVSVAQHTVSVDNLPQDQTITVYTAAGQPVMQTTAPTFDLPHPGVYLIRIATRTFKLAI